MFFITEMSQTVDKLGCSALDPFNAFDVFNIAWRPQLYTVFQVWSNVCLVKDL